MAVFSYKALDKDNNYTKSVIEARSQKKALLHLEKQGFLVVSIKQEKKKTFLNIELSKQRVKRLDKILFTRHLHTLLESGIALDQALKIASEQSSNKTLKEISFDLHQKVKKGQTLNSALKSHGKYFSPFFINLIQVGEKSGTLENVLLHLLEQQEQDYELITKTRGAMIYPAVIIVAAFMIVIMMMTFVVPTITELLTEYSVEIPLTTKLLIFISHVLNNYGLLILIAFILAIAAIRQWVKTPSGKKHWDEFKLSVPILKNIVVEFNLARFARSMSSLLKSGMSIDEALDLTSTVSGNVFYKDSIKSSIAFVRKGVPLTEVLHGYPKLYPPMTTRMIEIGQKTGKTDNMFTRLAIFYEKSVLNTIQNLSSIIEPVLLLLIGVGVGFIAVSILTPIWKFAETI